MAFTPEKIALLSLCYDSVQEVNDKYMVVSLDGKHGVVNENNEEVIELGYKLIEVHGKNIFIQSNDFELMSELDGDTLEEVRKVVGVRDLSDGAYRTYLTYGQQGLYNRNNEEILPQIYGVITELKGRRSSNKRFVKATIGRTFSMSENENERSCVILDKNFENPDCLAAFETSIDTLQIVVSSVIGSIEDTAIKASSAVWQKDLEGLFRFRVRYNGKVAGKEYDSIFQREALNKHSLLQTYKFNDKSKTTTGLVRFDGTEVVPCDRYTSVQYIGNGISIVGKDSQYGTYRDGKEILPVGTFDNISVMNGIPASVGFKHKEVFFIGNDGKAYSKITDAFPSYRSRIDNVSLLVNLYGNWAVYKDDRLHTLGSLASEYSDRTSWVKI
jgi:hypothetical protein